MAVRSLTANPDGVQQINRALTAKKWTRDDLWQECDCSRQPAIKFCSGKSVNKKLFVSFCEALELDWEEIAGLKASAPVPDSAEPQTDIDALVHTIREKVHADIHHRCGTMRVLDMEQPIGIGDIYTSVNILEKLSGRRRLGLDELLQDCDLENFDRFLLGQIRNKRVPGLEAVERYDKLIILGKPGAGKTTFMKRLATLCNQGEFQPHRVPVFITLKEFAEAQGKPELHAYIDQQWQNCEIEAAEALSKVLKQGQVLVLLDGLDEVQETDHDRILQEIQDFTRQYRDCQFVMTCRIAAREYVFQHFTEVEVADFNEEQIAEFATKWFKTKGVPDKAQNFTQRLKDNKQIRELANSPLLLTLLCLIFEERNDFLPNRAELYEEGTRLLLKKWDADREIKRDQVYKKLSLKCKEELFGQLAFKTFERGDYFFKQSVVEQHITDYIRHLPGTQEDEDALQLDDEAVLKSIEAQHGLLVERARSIYSFSHLTFQEYFTAKQITRPTARLPQVLADLVQNITSKRYREIFLMTIEMLPKADDFLVLLKQQIDLIVANDRSINAFLKWISKKTDFEESKYKKIVVRTFYFTISQDLSFSYHMLFKLEPEFASQCSFSFVNGCLEEYQIRNLVYDLEPNLSIDLALLFALDIAKASYEAGPTIDALDMLDEMFDFVLEKAREIDLSFCNKLMDLRRLLPDTYGAEDEMNVWWESSSKHWIGQFKLVMIEHRNIGQDWFFSKTYQKGRNHFFDAYGEFYYANKLLVDCLNSDCYVTKATRQYIEDTLLLPMSEIDKQNAEVGIRRSES